MEVVTLCQRPHTSLHKTGFLNWAKANEHIVRDAAQNCVLLGTDFWYMAFPAAGPNMPPWAAPTGACPQTHRFIRILQPTPFSVHGTLVHILSRSVGQGEWTVRTASVRMSLC